MMKRSILFVAGLLAVSVTASAQIKQMPGDSVTKTGVVEAIDHQNRVLTLRGEKGDFVTVDVPESVERFADIKVGDTISARYYDNVTVRKKEPGEKAVDTDTAAISRAAGAKPAGTAATQRTITATIEAIDPKVPSITFKGPNGWNYSRRIMDKDVLKQVKVGDQVDFTWTEAVLISVIPPKK